ncbi:MAG: peptide chain release factor N(5)-glutamine methyltransferase [Candidatus Omnitrophota bacterium]
MTEAELLFTQILNCSRAELHLNRRRTLKREEASFLACALRRRFYGEPLQYVLGKTEFMGFEFIVNADVFIPRPETEILAEKALSYSRRLPVDDCQILDIGTGSGCIAISLAGFLPKAGITATDISEKALDIAKSNAYLNKVEQRISFIHCDLFPHNLKPNTYDLIVTNPPYIPSAQIEKLQLELSHEPRMALDGGIDGLDFYRRIIRDSWAYLKKKGLLIMEMGFNQCAQIRMLLNSSEFEVIEVVKDYNNIDRAIVASINY